MVKTAEILVTGKVQGVWFRYYVKKNAILLRLNGWVKNNSDGTVSITIEGDKKNINQLIDKIKIGSPLSKVEKVQITLLPFENQFNTFRIIK